MNMLLKQIKCITLAIFVMISQSAYAKVLYHHDDVSKNGYYDTRSLVTLDDNGGWISQLEFIDDDGNHVEMAWLLIWSSEGGNQKIYLNIISSNNDMCDVNEVTENKILKVNGQNVKFHAFCRKETGYKNTIYFTPKSKRGENYVLSEAKKKNFVSFEYNDGVFNLSMKGFTKAWNSYGGDAL